VIRYVENDRAKSSRGSGGGKRAIGMVKVLAENADDEGDESDFCGHDGGEFRKEG